MNNLALTFCIFIIAQILAWFQANGQFSWAIFKNHPFIFAFVIGGIASYLFALAHKYSYSFFDGVVWPGRMIAFSTGIFVFTIMTWLVMGEAFNLKTVISIGLALVIVAIQIWF